MIEVEKKFRLSLDAWRRWIDFAQRHNLGASKQRTIFDCYFDDHDFQLEAKDIWLRYRKEEPGSSFWELKIACASVAKSIAYSEILNRQHILQSLKRCADSVATIGPSKTVRTIRQSWCVPGSAFGAHEETTVLVDADLYATLNCSNRGPFMPPHEWISSHSESMMDVAGADSGVTAVHCSDCLRHETENIERTLSANHSPDCRKQSGIFELSVMVMEEQEVPAAERTIGLLSSLVGLSITDTCKL